MNIVLPDNSDTEKVYFTGDKPITTIYCNPGSYIQLQVNLRIYPYQGLTSFQSLIKEYKVMSASGIVNISLGEIVEPYFHKPTSLKEIFYFYELQEGSNIIPLYKPMEADITFREFNYTTNELLDEKSYTLLKFLRGKSSGILNLSKQNTIGRISQASVISCVLYEDSPAANPSEKCIFETYKNQLFYNGIVVLKLLKISYESTTHSVTIFNAADTTDILLKKRKVSDITVNGQTYTTIQQLSEILTPILYKAFQEVQTNPPAVIPEAPVTHARIFMYRNNQYLSSFSSEKQTLTSVLWKDSTLQPGDVFILENQVSPGSADKKITFPKGIQSYHLLWLDQNLSLRIVEFTGRIEHKPVCELIQNTWVNIQGTKITETIEAIPGKELLLNTGQLMKEDVFIIKSLIGNLKAWISFDNLQTFTSFYLKTTNPELKYTSEQTLFNFDLEVVLNQEDTEDHRMKASEPEYDLIFTYQVSEDNLSVDLTNCFDYPLQSVNWGDGTEDELLTHLYSSAGEYTLQIKVSLLSLLFFQFKNVTEIKKIPSSVDKIDCTGCMMNLIAIKNLFRMVNSFNQTNAEVVFTDSTYSFFSKYVIVSTQQEPVLLDEETISEAQKLIKKYWYIDYTYNRNFSQGADAVPSSRYMTASTYTKIYPARHTLRITGSKTYFFNDEDISFTMSVYKGTEVPWGIYDFECFVYPRVDIKENDNWKVQKMAEFPVNADAVIPFNLGILNEGTHTIRGVQQSYPWVISKKIYYDRLKTATVEFDVITRDSVYVKKDTNNEWEHNEFDIDIPAPYLNFYPFGFISYSGSGIQVGYYPTAVFSSVLSAPELKEKTVFITGETGTYLFSFKNYTIDLSGILSSLKSAVFYIAYVTPANKIEVSNPVYMDANGKIIINKDFTVTNIPAGSYICPFINTEIKSGITHITGKWDIVNFSRLVIKKI